MNQPSSRITLPRGASFVAPRLVVKSSAPSTRTAKSDPSAAAASPSMVVREGRKTPLQTGNGGGLEICPHSPGYVETFGGRSNENHWLRVRLVYQIRALPESIGEFKCQSAP